MRDVNIQKAVTTHMIQNPDFKRYIQAAVAQPQPLAIEWQASEQVKYSTSSYVVHLSAIWLFLFGCYLQACVV